MAEFICFDPKDIGLRLAVQAVKACSTPFEREVESSVDPEIKALTYVG